MLSRYNVSQIDLILQAEHATPPFPAAADREAWDKIRVAIGPAETQRIIQYAEAAAQEPIPALPATLYLEFNRNGERLGYQTPRDVRRRNLGYLTLAECLEYESRFLDAIMDLAWAICEESSWAAPAHQGMLTDIYRPVVDLNAALAGTHLAEMDHLIGAELDPRVRKRIHDEIDRRLLTPYLTRHDHWWLHDSDIRSLNNWTAVCNGNIVTAALYIEKDTARLAEIIARALRSLDDYLATYDMDGGSSEGPGPWVFGFSNYMLMAHLLEHRTNGRINVLDDPLIRKIAQFPLKTIMAPGHWVNFSDTESTTGFPDGFLMYTANRLNLPGLITLYHEQRQRQAPIDRENDLQWLLRRTVWQPDTTPAEPAHVIPNAHDWYGGMHWMFARVDPTNPDALVLAAKGGHNGEMHNQNDIGHFIVQLNQEQLIADLGRGRFTRAYFGENRYQDFSCQSLGHACPVPNGQMQGPHSAPERLKDGTTGALHEEMRGENYYATLLDHQASDTIDLMKLEMKHAYSPAADLDSLVRTIALHRDEAAWIELVDEVYFATQPGTYESVLITFGKAFAHSDNAVIQGERGGLSIRFDAAQVQARVETVSQVPLTGGLYDIQRIIFTWRQPQQRGIIRLTIHPHA